MSKVAHYLQEHLQGEVMTSPDARRYFSTDASILQLAPALVAYPRNENDVRKTARFTWQLAERGRVIPLTARGAGTDLAGAALGSGIMLVFPAHMNRILELDTKANTVTVEPGISFGKLQQALHTHGRFIPAYPASIEYSTVGGAVANNASGEKSGKYGDMRSFVQGLRVVLANGEVIETRRLSKREVNKKLGLATFEGEIYRSIDTLLEEQRETVDGLYRNVSTNNAGYALWDVRRKDGSVDLTQLFTGSQGTLGVITEIIISTEVYNPQTTLMLTAFETVEGLGQAMLELRSLSELPSALEVVDGNMLKKVYEQNPNLIKDVLQPPYPAVVLLAEFDGSGGQLKKAVKKASKIFEKYALSLETTTDPEQQQQYWKLRQATSAVIADNEALLKSVPLVDAAVPVDQIPAYLTGTYQILKQAGLQPAVWGHAGEGVFHLQPRLNLGQVGDRQKAFRLMDEFAKLALSLGGTVSSEAGDGRLRTPYLPAQYGAEGYALLQKVKEIFDPYNTLNPGVKFGTSLEDIKSAIRPAYTLDHLYDHLPRS
jgi:FAD/FMN-containing dehydrogenase